MILRGTGVIGSINLHMKEYSVYIGIGAGIMTAISMLPQLIKIIKDKKTEDISFVMLFVLLSGIGGWIWYGILKNDYPIILTNSFSFIVNLLVITFSVKYRNKNMVIKKSQIF
jgi:MtN3 and saliva related transmembrane protein